MNTMNHTNTVTANCNLIHFIQKLKVNSKHQNLSVDRIETRYMWIVHRSGWDKGCTSIGVVLRQCKVRQASLFHLPHETELRKPTERIVQNMARRGHCCATIKKVCLNFSSREEAK